MPMPASRRQYSTACLGKRASCFLREKRSSWAAATSVPSSSRAAALSWYSAESPRIRTSSEERVDERGEHRALGRHEEPPQQEHHHEDWREPVLLAHPHETVEILHQRPHAGS